MYVAEQLVLFSLNILGTDFMIMQHVRRAAVLALNTFAHYKPNLIKGLLPDLLPLLYDQTIVKVTYYLFKQFIRWKSCVYYIITETSLSFYGKQLWCVTCGIFNIVI